MYTKHEHPTNQMIQQHKVVEEIAIKVDNDLVEEGENLLDDVEVMVMEEEKYIASHARRKAILGRTSP